MSTQQTGLLVIRAWVEEGSTEPLRAHLRVTNDISRGIEQTLTLTRTEAVRDHLNAWLDRLLEADASTTDL